MITLLYKGEVIGTIQDPTIRIVGRQHIWDTHIIRFSSSFYNKIFQNYRQNVPLELKDNDENIFYNVWIDKPNYIWQTSDWIIYENVKLFDNKRTSL